MRFCTKCGKQNEDYCNYCSKDGENLNNLQSRLMLTENKNSFCDICNNPIKTSQTYCPKCGHLLSEVRMRTRYNTQNQNFNTLGNPDYIDNIKKVDFGAEELAEDARKMFVSLPEFFEDIKFGLKNFDYIGFFQNNIKTAFLTGLASVIFVALFPLLITLILSLVGVNIGAVIGISSLAGLSTPKLFLMTLTAMSVPKMVFTFSGVTVKLALRTFLAPFISGCLIVLATRIMFKERRYQSLPMATLGALSYSVIMVVISLFARYQITQGVVYYSILSVFLNSFIISFIAMMMALEKENSKIIGTLSNIFRHNFNTVLKMILGISIAPVVIIFVYMVVNGLDNTQYFSMYASEFWNLVPYNIGLGLFLGLIIGFLLLSPWILLFIQFVSFHAVITSTNILSQGGIAVLIIVPIIVLVVMGRSIKTRYGEGRNSVVAMYSICYTSIMVLLSYFSKIIFSGDLSKLSSGLYSLFDEYASGGDYSIGTTMSGYIGTSCIMTLIVTLILSFVCMYIGYRTKKLIR